MDVEASLDDLRGQAPLIHEVDQVYLRPLYVILDADSLWAEIAPSMPDITPLDVDGCRKFHDQGGSPSEFLLRIWASKGYSIIDLYSLFAISRLVRCMERIRPAVNPRFHYLEDYCLPNIDTKKPAMVSTGRAGASALATGGGSSSAVPSSARGNSARAGPSTSSLVTPTSSGSRVTDDSNTIFAGMKNTPAVTYQELQAATSNFATENIIGRGGYGVVYKGEWKQTQVAVKRLTIPPDGTQRHEKERLRQSLQELNTLARYRHDHILPVYGYSLDGQEPCLVYQYMANGSLDDRLQCKKGTPPLTWSQKLNIARGSATALHYLHTISRTPVFHGDVKTANILLDKHLEPKLGDFGLSREGQIEIDVEDKSILIASHIKGTLAYLPPEFVSSKVLSTKLDVYSFGVVLLEIATGLRAYVDSRKPASLVDLAFDVDLKAKVDRKKNESDVERSMRLFELHGDKRTPTSEEKDKSIFGVLWRLGVSCSARERNDRPSFGVVVDHLKLAEALAALAAAKKMISPVAEQSNTRIRGVFKCNEPHEYLVVVREGEVRGFYGSLSIMAVVGHGRVDGGLIPEQSNESKKTYWRKVCAPYAEGRPILVSVDSDLPSSLTPHRATWRIKELTPEWNAVQLYMNNRPNNSSVLLLRVSKIPSAEARIVYTLHEGYLSPPPNANYRFAYNISVSFFNTMIEDTTPIKSYDTASTHNINAALDQLQSRTGRTVVLVVGDKNRGKSAFTRKIVNYLWTEDERKTKSVYLMDMDIGQSEFTPQGCMSCRKINGPILDVPFNHQEEVFEDAYLIGNVTVANPIEEKRYLKSMHLLYSKWRDTSEQDAVLVVNTMGWIMGFGKRVLDELISISGPRFVFNMLGAPSTSHLARMKFHVPKHCNEITVTWNTPSPATQQPRFSLTPAQLRQLTTISYFAKCLSECRPVLSAFSEVSPYGIDLEDLCIVLPPNMTSLPDQGIFSFLNLTVVALAIVEGSKMSRLDRRRMINVDVLPWIVVKKDEDDPWKILGYAIIRGVDIKKKKLFLLTPLPIEAMQRVDCIVCVSHMDVPPALIYSQPFIDKPYVSSTEGMNTRSSAPLNDLYQGFVSRSCPNRQIRH